MAEHWKLILLFGIGVVASIINVNAGGGSSITLPALIFMGLESAVANGTNRIGILVQNISAVSSFRQQQFHDFKRSLTLALFTLPGAIAGALLSVRLTSEWFQRILSVIMIGIVFSMFFGRPSGGKAASSEKRSVWIYLAMLGIGFYGGFIQVGVGFLFMASLYHILKLSLARVNMHKVLIVLIYTIPVLVIFALTGNINWEYGLALSGGMAVGAWWGARISVKGGEKAIRYILSVAIVIMALKLLDVF